MTTLLIRADLDRCPWAVCGQTALAALLHLPLADVRDAVPCGRTWMTYKDMRDALAKLGAKQRSTGYEEARGNTRTPPCRWPTHGLALIQFRGPWEQPDVPHVACLKHTHWIASADYDYYEPMVFDVNALARDINHGWTPLSWWKERIMPPLIAAHRQATGAWYVRAGIEVLL